MFAQAEGITHVPGFFRYETAANQPGYVLGCVGHLEVILLAAVWQIEGIYSVQRLSELK